MLSTSVDAEKVVSPSSHQFLSILTLASQHTVASHGPLAMICIHLHVSAFFAFTSLQCFPTLFCPAQTAARLKRWPADPLLR